MACINCDVFDGGNFTTGAVHADVCIIQQIFNGGNFTTGDGNLFASEYCVIDGGTIDSNRFYGSVRWGTLATVPTISTREAGAFPERVSSDPRFEIIKNFPGSFSRTFTYNPIKEGHYVIVPQKYQQDFGFMFVGVLRNNSLVWAPVLFGVVSNNANGYSTLASSSSVD